MDRYKFIANIKPKEPEKEVQKPIVKKRVKKKVKKKRGITDSQIERLLLIALDRPKRGRKKGRVAIC